MSTAEKFIEQKGYPKDTSIEVLPELGESTYFKEYFGDWQHVEESAALKHFNLRPPKVRNTPIQQFSTLVSAQKFGQKLALKP